MARYPTTGERTDVRADPVRLPGLDFEQAALRSAKGWRRPDERILDDVAERIALCGADIDDVEVRVDRGVVTLTGWARSLEDRRMVEDVASEVLGVDDVYNRIRIAD
jgi:osmotically-inducible protein OsmY